ncbi:ATPase [Trypanosoma cruzi]|nr:ATPase [Trypanosoma cruzi]
MSGPYRICRCSPVVPVALLMCLPVLLFSSAPPAHPHTLSCTVLCRNVLVTAGRWPASRAGIVWSLRVYRWRWESRCHWMDACGTLLNCAGGRLTWLHDVRHVWRCCLLLGSFSTLLCVCSAGNVRCSVCADA